MPGDDKTDPLVGLRSRCGLPQKCELRAEGEVLEDESTTAGEERPERGEKGEDEEYLRRVSRVLVDMRNGEGAVLSRAATRSCVLVGFSGRTGHWGDMSPNSDGPHLPTIDRSVNDNERDRLVVAGLGWPVLARQPWR